MLYMVIIVFVFCFFTGFTLVGGFNAFLCEFYQIKNYFTDFEKEMICE